MKKIFVLTITILVILGIFCSCTPGTQDKGSSQIANIDTSSPNSENADKDAPSDSAALELFTKTCKMIIRSHFDNRDKWVSQDLENLKFISTDMYSADNRIMDPEILNNSGIIAYKKTDYSYNDAKEFYAQILSGELLNKFMTINFYDFDGKLGVERHDGYSKPTFKDFELEYKGFKNGVYSYTGSYSSDSYEDIDLKITYQCAFEIKKEDGKYKVCKNDFYSGPNKWDDYIYQSTDSPYIEQYPVNTGKPDDCTVLKLYQDAFYLIAESSYITATELIPDYFPNCTIDYSQSLGIKRTIDGRRYGYKYYKTNLTYKDVKKFYGRFYSGKLLEQYLNEFFLDANDSIYIFDCSGADHIAQLNLSLKYLKEQDGKYYYQAEFDKIGRSNYGKGTNTIIIEAVDGGYRICKSDIVPTSPILGINISKQFN